MAPELMSEKPYDHLADLWSLGCIIYETLAGEPPFCTTSFIRLVKLIRHEHVKWPSFLTDNCITFLKVRRRLIYRGFFDYSIWFFYLGIARKGPIASNGVDTNSKASFCKRAYCNTE